MRRVFDLRSASLERLAEELELVGIREHIDRKVLVLAIARPDIAELPMLWYPPDINRSLVAPVRRMSPPARPTIGPAVRASLTLALACWGRETGLIRRQ